MTRAELEHVIRACAQIVDDDEIVVIGSQAILGTYPDAPPSLLVSREADVYPRNRPERAELIAGTIGELSPFHTTFGYYAHGVGPETAVAPSGWEARLVAVCNENTRGATGWCLEVHDLALAKAVAGRAADIEYVRDLLRHGLVVRAELESRIGALPIEAEERDRVRSVIEPAT